MVSKFVIVTSQVAIYSSQLGELYEYGLAALLSLIHMKIYSVDFLVRYIKI